MGDKFRRARACPSGPGSGQDGVIPEWAFGRKVSRPGLMWRLRSAAGGAHVDSLVGQAFPSWERCCPGPAGAPHQGGADHTRDRSGRRVGPAVATAAT